MTFVSAKIIQQTAATSPEGEIDVLTTYVLTYPLSIHAEFLTHRALSRNAASSRAISHKRFRRDMIADMAMPLHWGQEQKGMQAEQELPPWKQMVLESFLVLGGYYMAGVHWLGEKLGAHKQVVNPYLAPWKHITVVATGDSAGWANFFAQRDHHDAHPTMRALARNIRHAWCGGPGFDRHLPFVRDDERGPGEKELSVARCARVSYLSHNGKADQAADIVLYNRLRRASPPHWSPFEHVARPAWGQGKRNFKNFITLREELEK